MKILKAKAIRIHNNEWIIGYPVLSSNDVIWMSVGRRHYAVHPETLCYSTLEVDVNGRELFIGDTINDFGITFYVDDPYQGYTKGHAFGSYNKTGDTTRLGEIIFQEGTTKIKIDELDFGYNIVSGKLRRTEFMYNKWDLIYNPISTQK